MNIPPSVVSGRRNFAGLFCCNRFRKIILVVVRVFEFLHSQGQELTPEVKDIWSAVRHLTPPDALIFTDQVDETINPLGGWNTYAFSGQRQIFLSSYYTAFELRSDEARLRQLLSINDSVLRGTKSPAEVPTRSHYDSMFAVI